MQALKEVTLARFEDQEGDREYTAEELAITYIERIRALFLAQVIAHVQACELPG